MPFDNYLLGISSVLTSLLGCEKQKHVKVGILTVEDLSLIIKNENIIKKISIALWIQSLESVLSAYNMYSYYLCIVLRYGYMHNDLQLTYSAKDNCSYLLSITNS